MFKICLAFLILGLHQSCGHVSSSSSYRPNIDIEDPGVKHSRVRRLSGVPKPVWHVAIYNKKIIPYQNICGGTVVKNDIVISAAHCFVYNGNPSDPSNFAVAGNKNYRIWNDTDLDPDAQKSEVSTKDHNRVRARASQTFVIFYSLEISQHMPPTLVKEIIIPPQYHGEAANYQSDIAVVRLETPFRYSRGLRPACLDFDADFERTQLRDGNRGTIAGWGLTAEEGTPSKSLLWLESPYVSPARCIDSVEKNFINYITWDKICAGDNTTGKAACKGDSGGGLIFWRGRTANAVPYFRGIASVAPRSESFSCNVFTVVGYTRVNAHRDFLLEAVPGLGQSDQCQFELSKLQLHKDGQPVWQL